MPKNYAKLVPLKKRVTRGGKTYLATFYINPNKELTYDTQSLYSKRDGTYTVERLRKHKTIINSIVKTCPKSENPEVILLQGGAGAGKSHILENVVLGDKGMKNFGVINNDIIKESIPEYGDFIEQHMPSAAARVHEESSFITANTVNKVVQEKRNFIYDATLGKPEKIKKLVQELKSKGYKIKLVHVTVDMEIAKERVKQRAKKRNRFVPMDIVEETHKGTVSAFDSVKDMVDDYVIYDNNDFDKLIEIENKKDGIKDESARKRFLTKKDYKQHKFKFRELLEKYGMYRREDMPQVTLGKSTESAGFKKFLSHLSDKDISYKEKYKKAKVLKPSQNEVNEDRIAEYFKNPKEKLEMAKERTFVTSNDGYILDGHHYWAFTYEHAPDTKLHVIEVDLPIKDLIDESFNVEGVTSLNLEGEEITKALESFYASDDIDLIEVEVLEKASKYGKGKKVQDITVRKKTGGTYTRRQLVGEEDKPTASKGIKKYVEQTKELYKRNNMTTINGYYGVEDFVSKHGKSYKASKKPSDVEWGAPKECYKNAFNLAVAHPDKYTYVEGWAKVEGLPIPLEHAWVVDKEGNVVDNTWKDTGEEYYGVAFKNDYLLDTIVDKETYGVFYGNTKVFKDKESDWKAKTKKAREPQWFDEYMKYNLTRYPIGVDKTDVEINTSGDVNSHWIMKWTDDKTGRTIRAYSKEFMERNAQDKWARMRAYDHKKVDDIQASALSMLDSEDDSDKEVGAIIAIIAMTGLRVGSMAGFKDTGNRGVSTLQAGDIEVNKNTINFSFKGKSHKHNTAKIVNKKLAEYLSGLKKSGMADDAFLFKANKKKLAEAFKTMAGDDKFKIKDLRTFVATNIAKQELFSKEIELPKNKSKIKQILQKRLNEVFDVVANQLNNTRNMAKTSYVHPNVISAWLEHIGVNPSVLEKGFVDKLTPTLGDILKSSENKGKVHNFAESDSELDEYLLPDWWDEEFDDESQYKFYDKPTLGMKRTQMPQVDAEHIGEFVKHFTKTEDVNIVKMQIGKIKPTQGEINEDKVLGMISSGYDWTQRIYIISKDGWLLDGHHAYAVGLEEDETKEVDVVKIDLDMIDLIRRSNKLKLTKKVDVKDKIVKAQELWRYPLNSIITPNQYVDFIDSQVEQGQDSAHVEGIIKKLVEKAWIEDGLEEPLMVFIKKDAPIEPVINKLYDNMFKSELSETLDKFKLSHELESDPEWYFAKSFDDKGTIGIKLGKKIYERRMKSFKRQLKHNEDIEIVKASRLLASEAILSTIKSRLA